MLISVVTICYNEEKKIKDTLRSVLEQSCLEFEYIIKDGNSNDKTNKYISEYIPLFQVRDVKIKHIIEKDSGIYNAMNTASSYCSGEYIIFLNAGDRFVNKEVLKKCSEKMKCYADVYYGDAIIEDDAGKAIFRADMELIRKRMAFVHQASFVKRELLTKYLFGERYKICADYNFFLSVFKEGGKFINLEEIICLYEANGISSTKFLKKRWEHEKILFKNEENNITSFFLHIMEAAIKEILLKLLPKKILSNFKRWYKWRIKKYEKYGE